jgi:hypothetical protein
MDLRVADLAAAEPFYDALYRRSASRSATTARQWKVWATTEPLPGTAYFGITESLGHLPNENRIAFWSRAARTSSAWLRSLERPALWS